MFSLKSMTKLEDLTVLIQKISIRNKIISSILCMYKIVHRMRICQRNPRIACSTDQVSILPLKELHLSLKNKGGL
jgi:hypothetical protein